MPPTPSRSPASTTSSGTSTWRRSRSSSRRRASASGFWFWREQEDTGFTNVNFDFKHQFTAPGHELRLNLQYTRGLEDEAYFLNEDVAGPRQGTDMTHLIAAENTLPLSIDYMRPLSTGRLELGTKLQRRWIPVTYTVERGQQSVIYQGLGDFSDWDENIYAAYANLVRVKDAGTRWKAASASSTPKSATRFPRTTSTTRGATPTTTSRSSRT